MSSSASTNDTAVLDKAILTNFSNISLPPSWAEEFIGSDLQFYYYLWTYVAPCIFALITLVGIAGNSLVIYVIISKEPMQHVTNFLLLNLAIADIVFLLICAPVTAYKYAASSWPLGDASCMIVKYCLYVSTYVTVYTLVAISVLRFLTVVYNTSTIVLRTKRNVIIVIVSIWLCMLGLNIPTLLVHRKKTHAGYTYCGIEKSAVGPVFVTFFLFAYALPLVIICLLYVLILCHLKRASSAMLEQTRERTARACRVITLVVVVFGLSWLPLHVNSLVAYFGKLPSGAYYEVFRILWNCMAYGNSCANPFIYNYVSSEFKKGFQETMCNSCCKRNPKRKGDKGNMSETMVMM